jgi:3-dehydroquinate synthase
MPELFDIRSSPSNYQVVSERNALASWAPAMRDGVVIADAYFSNDLASRGVVSIALQADEAAKSLDAIGGVIVQMREAGATRDTHLWAVGGGAIQDVAAFVSSIYMRGMSWTYIPTTLLGMVDSCIGGKSSINVGSFKNIVGTFHSPKAIVIDSTLLSTLTIEQRIAGLSEAAKICYCRGADVFAEYLSLAPNVDLAAEGLEAVIHLSLGAKKWFIEIDEFDRSERLLLNLGHTFGHALEGASDYRLGHGVAVGVGMLCALALSRQMLSRMPGGAAASLESHVRSLLGAMPDLPGILETIDVHQTFDRLKSDKKHESENYRFVTFDANGVVQITRLPKTDDTRTAVMAALHTTLELLSQ